MPAILAALAACARFSDDSAAFEAEPASASEKWVEESVASGWRCPCEIFSIGPSSMWRALRGAALVWGLRSREVQAAGMPSAGAAPRVRAGH